MPCCGSVGGCGAQAVSRKTPIYFMYFDLFSTLYICAPRISFLFVMKLQLF